MRQTAKHFSVGDIKCAVFSDGKLVDPENTFDLNCLYIEAGGRKILVDNGCGPLVTATAGKLVENMEAEGLETADITDIIFTHGHIDHVSGTCDVKGKPVFPNARYIITKKEWEYIKAPPGKNQTQNVFYESARKYLPPLHGRFDLVDDGFEVLPGIKLVPAHGHTPGNSMVAIKRGGERLLCIGDIIHMTRELTEPRLCASFDVSPAEALKTRTKILSQAAKEGAFIFACHFDFPGLGHIREKKSVLAWEAI